MSLITLKQIQTIQIARRQVEQVSDGVFDESQWRITLRNVGRADPDTNGRVSVKALDQRGFELVMAFLEERGYREAGRQADHWRGRQGVGDGRATSRQVHEINRLAAGGRYPLAAMIGRVIGQPASDPALLSVCQAHKLIEALKAVGKRNSKASATVADENSEAGGRVTDAARL